MKIDHVEKHLQRLNKSFDVLIEKEGTQLTLYKNLIPSDVSDLLHEVIEAHNPDKLFIQVRRKNGTSSMPEGNLIQIDFGGLDGIGRIHEAEKHRPANLPGIPDNFKDYIISDLKEKNVKLESRVSSLEDENNRLTRENLELEKDKMFRDKEFELTLKERDSEQKSGLNGIMESLNNNPVLANVAATAIGRLMGIDLAGEPAALGEGEQAHAMPQTQPRTIQGQVTGYVSKFIGELDDENARMFFSLVKIVQSHDGGIEGILDILKEEVENA